MSATLAITPASGSITSKVTVCRVEVTEADQNTLTGYDSAIYPSSPALTYYLLFDAPNGTDNGRSYAFGVDESGNHTFNNYIFPASGDYTVRLRNAADDSDAATLAVTVS